MSKNSQKTPPQTHHREDVRCVLSIVSERADEFVYDEVSSLINTLLDESKIATANHETLRAGVEDLANDWLKAPEWVEVNTRTLTKRIADLLTVCTNADCQWIGSPHFQEHPCGRGPGALVKLSGSVTVHYESNVSTDHVRYELVYSTCADFERACARYGVSPDMGHADLDPHDPHVERQGTGPNTPILKHHCYPGRECWTASGDRP